MLIKNKNLYILNDNLSDYSDLFTKIKDISPINIEFLPFLTFISEDYRVKIKALRPADMVVAGESVFLNRIFEQLNEFFQSIYNHTFNNIIYIYFDADFFHHKESFTWTRNSFLLSNDPLKFTQQAINFNHYALKLLNELTISERLNGYIVDSFQEIVNSEILKGQKKEIESLNKELDAKNNKLMSDLGMAQRVQISLIPKYANLKKIKELDIGFAFSPLESVGGDLLDIIRIGKNKYGLLIFDVSGHGVTAALITTMAKFFFNSNTEYKTMPSQVCNNVHKGINEFVGDLFYYLTAFYGIIDLETAELHYTNAGHQPAVLYHAKTNTLEMLYSTGSLIGILQDPKYETLTISLHEGDKILLFTDGIIEAKNTYGDYYDVNRLLNFFETNHDMPPKKFVKKLLEDVNTFSGEALPDDDKAILMVEFLSKSKSHK